MDFILGSFLKDRISEGTTGTSPLVKELDEALQKHELFIYFGHGNGSDHIPRNVIQKLDRCAAIFLMGCRSGTISFKAHYCQRGAPLDFFSRGSPLVVANLRAVNGDIGLFSKSLLDECIRKRPANLPGINQGLDHSWEEPEIRVCTYI